MAKLFLYFKVKELPQVSVVSFTEALPVQMFLPLWSDLQDWGMKDVYCKMKKLYCMLYITILIMWLHIYDHGTCIN